MNIPSILDRFADRLVGSDRRAAARELRLAAAAAREPVCRAAYQLAVLRALGRLSGDDDASAGMLLAIVNVTFDPPVRVFPSYAEARAAGFRRQGIAEHNGRAYASAFDTVSTYPDIWP